jgi:hypothetical protein
MTKLGLCIRADGELSPETLEAGAGLNEYGTAKKVQEVNSEIRQAHYGRRIGIPQESDIIV